MRSRVLIVSLCWLASSPSSNRQGSTFSEDPKIFVRRQKAASISALALTYHPSNPLRCRLNMLSWLTVMFTIKIISLGYSVSQIPGLSALSSDLCWSKGLWRFGYLWSFQSTAQFSSKKMLLGCHQLKVQCLLARVLASGCRDFWVYAFQNVGRKLYRFG